MIVWVQYVLYDMHALLDFPLGVVSNTVDGNLQTVVYDMTVRSPWYLHMTLVQVSFLLFCAAWGIIHWRSFATVIVSVWAVGWFAWQAYDTWTAQNVREAGKWEWIPLLFFFLLTALIAYLHERAGLSHRARTAAGD